MLISLEIDDCFVDDLQDDFLMNDKLNLYEFIGKDPTKAFYLGYNIKEWFNQLDKEQRYLYSKQIRHNKDDLEKYQSQIEFWTNKYSKEDEVDLAEMAEYILNNMFWDEQSEDSDRVKLAFFFGQMISQNTNRTKSEDSIILQIDSNGNVVKEWKFRDSFEGFNRSAILKCCRGQQGSHKGFNWKFKDD